MQLSCSAEKLRILLIRQKREALCSRNVTQKPTLVAFTVYLLLLLMLKKDDKIAHFDFKQIITGL